MQQSIYSNAYIYSLFDNIFAILLNVIEIELTPTPTLFGVSLRLTFVFLAT